MKKNRRLDKIEKNLPEYNDMPNWYMLVNVVDPETHTELTSHEEDLKKFYLKKLTDEADPDKMQVIEYSIDEDGINGLSWGEIEEMRDQDGLFD